MKLTEANFDALVDTAMLDPNVAHMGQRIKQAAAKPPSSLARLT